MYSKIVILKFPATEARKPIVCQLTKKFDIMFNILNASITSKKEGYMVLDLSSDSKPSFNKGIKFLKDQGVDISYPEHQIFKDEEICTHCGACTAVCPTDALYIIRPSMEVVFEKDKCSVCELCILTCPSRAMGLFSEQKENLTL